MIIDKNTFNLKKFKNRFKVISSYKSRTTYLSSCPVEIILEITNNCNLDCIMCPRVNMKRAVSNMKLDLFKKIIDEVKDHAELVYLAGGLGEPTMHRNLGAMIAYCKANNVRVGLSTNATILTKKITDTILTNQPDLILLSLDGATKEIHEKIRVNSVFERTMGMVKYFLEEKQKRNLEKIYTIVQMIYMPANKSEAEEFKSKWQQFKSVNEVRFKKFLYLQGADYYPEPVKNDFSANSCVLPWRQLSISHDGKVAICCRDLDFTTITGDVTENTIQEIWNSDQFRRYRELISSQKKDLIPICKSCKGLPASFPMRVGCTIFDDYTIRKLLPFIEKFVLKTGLKSFDYE